MLRKFTTNAALLLAFVAANSNNITAATTASNRRWLATILSPKEVDGGDGDPFDEIYCNGPPPATPMFEQVDSEAGGGGGAKSHMLDPFAERARETAFGSFRMEKEEPL